MHSFLSKSIPLIVACNICIAAPTAVPFQAPKELLELHNQIIANPSLLDNSYPAIEAAPTAPQGNIQPAQQPRQPLIVTVFINSLDNSVDEFARDALAITKRYPEQVEFHFRLLINSHSRPRDWASAGKLGSFEEFGAAIDRDDAVARSHGVRFFPAIILSYQGKRVAIDLKGASGTILNVLQQMNTPAM
jgi:hypothetical protein